jgi:N-acetylglucosamine-6-phosphate deacetylase
MLAAQDTARSRAQHQLTAAKQLPPLKIGVASLHKHAADLACAAVVKLTNARLYAGPGKPLVHGDLWFQHGRIIDPAKRFWEAASAGRFACDVEVDVEGRIVAPGFLDIQFNGAWGVDFSDPSITPSDIETVLLKLPTTGVTSLCPTLVSSNAHTYRAVLQQVRS